MFFIVETAVASHESYPTMKTSLKFLNLIQKSISKLFEGRFIIL